MKVMGSYDATNMDHSGLPKRMVATSDFQVGKVVGPSLAFRMVRVLRALIRLMLI